MPSQALDHRWASPEDKQDQLELTHRLSSSKAASATLVLQPQRSFLSSSNGSLDFHPSQQSALEPSHEMKTTVIKPQLTDRLCRSPSIASSNFTSLTSPPHSLRFLEASRQLQDESASLESCMQQSGGPQSPIAQILDYCSYAGKSHQYMIILSISAVIVLKASVGLGAYSGFAQAPLFGDLEAQRHWMGLTLHRRISEWYFYDLNYWGLDYPPLTAYHSWLLAHIGQFLNPLFVALRPPLADSDPTGWGKLHNSIKFFLRWSVIGSDLVSWVPMVFLYCFVCYDANPRLKSCPEQSRISRVIQNSRWKSAIHSALLLLLNPNLILIDNGHFQYNSIMLGLTLGSVVSFHLNRDLLGAALYVCSICFKQMALYYSPAIFAYLFGKCLFLRHKNHDGFTLFFKLAIVSLITLVIAFSPLVLFAPFPTTIIQAIHRIFPLARGLFEDKVANFWCAANVLVKFRNLASVTTLAKVALLMTFLALLPGMMVMIWVSWTLAPTRSSQLSSEDDGAVIPRSVNLLPYALFNTSMSFYLFSFQVHEKSILLPLLPLMMMMSRRYSANRQDDINNDWQWTCLISNVACFSMWPLLKKDGLCWQYGTLVYLYNYLIGHNPFEFTNRSTINALARVIYASMCLIHLCELMIPSPPGLPDLYVVLNLTLSFTIFGLGYLWSGLRLLEEGWGLVGLTSNSTLGSPQPSTQPEGLRPPLSRSATISSDHDARADTFGPGMRFFEESAREPSKTKRATSLQARPKKTAQQAVSDEEVDRARSLKGFASAPPRVVMRMKPMISSPGAEKLLNRIRNRVNTDHVNSRAAKLGAPMRKRLLKEPVFPTADTVEDVGTQGCEELVSLSSLGQESECQGGRSSLGGEGDEGLIREGEFGEEEGEELLGGGGVREEKGECSLGGGGGGPTKLEVVEQDWETALRHSREGAIRRRREELRSGAKGIHSGGYVDAVDLVNGPPSRR